MKSTMWKICMLLIALSMLTVLGSFAEGSIGLVTLCLYGMSMLFGMQWACAEATRCEQAEQARAQARAARHARQPERAEEPPLHAA